MCIPGKTEDVNVELFNMITRINEVKALVKNISSDCKDIFDCEVCNSKCRKYRDFKKKVIWNPITFFGRILDI